MAAIISRFILSFTFNNDAADPTYSVLVISLLLQVLSLCISLTAG